jgi:hypothetical protein
VRRLKGRGGEVGVASVVVGVSVAMVVAGAFGGGSQLTDLVAGPLLVSESTARRRSYALARDMAISMCWGFWSLTSVFNGSRRPAV